MKKIKITKKSKESFYQFHLRVPLEIWDRVYPHMTLDGYSKVQEFGIELLKSYLKSKEK